MLNNNKPLRNIFTFPSYNRYISGMTSIGIWLLSCLMFVFGAVAEYAGNKTRIKAWSLFHGFRFRAKLKRGVASNDNNNTIIILILLELDGVAPLIADPPLLKLQQ